MKTIKYLTKLADLFDKGGNKVLADKIDELIAYAAKTDKDRFKSLFNEIDKEDNKDKIEPAIFNRPIEIGEGKKLSPEEIQENGLSKSRFQELEVGDHPNDIEEDDNGVVRYYKKNTKELDRRNGPSVVYPDGKKEFWRGNKHIYDVLPDGTIVLVNDKGEAHSEKSGDELSRRPAIMRPNGTDEWWDNGVYLGKKIVNPQDMPDVAEIWLNKNDQPSRRNAPAIKYKDGREQWFVNGELTKQKYRDGTIAEYNGNQTITTSADGRTIQYKDKNSGELHRVGGPAFISPAKKEYYTYGVLNRLDGPAIEYNYGEADGSDNDYYIAGQEISKKEFDRIVGSKGSIIKKVQEAFDNMSNKDYNKIKDHNNLLRQIMRS